MKSLERVMQMWVDNGFSVQIVDAPREANLFDKMLIVFSDQESKMIRKVSLYSSKTDKIVLEI